MRKMDYDEEIMRIVLLSIFVFIALALMFPNIRKRFTKASPKPPTNKSHKEKTDEEKK